MAREEEVDQGDTDRHEVDKALRRCREEDTTHEVVIVADQHRLVGMAEAEEGTHRQI